MTQSYYEPIQYDLDGKRIVLEKIIVISFGYEFYQKLV
jgi:hypothetical protein